MDESIAKSTQNDARYDIVSKHVTAGTTTIDEMKEKEIKEKEIKEKEIKENLAKYEQLFGADEDAFVQPTTSRKELWSYYLYYNGDNGVGPGSYSQALFQSALTSAGWDPAITPIEKGNCGNTGCVVSWGSGTRSVASVVLIANGLCFAIMTVIFVALGSAADYGTFGRWLLLFLTVVCWVFQYGMMAVRHPSQWPAAMVLHVISYIAYVKALDRARETTN
jgi:hypothetical protein